MNKTTAEGYFYKSSSNEAGDYSKENALQYESVSQPVLARSLKSRHIQLIAVGGAIGTALFVSISGGLSSGGPASLLIAFAFWSTIIWMVTSCCAEMVCYLPVHSPFIQMAGRCVDEAFEVTAAFNFYLMMLMYVPFEITAVNGLIHFWRGDYSPAITFCVQIFLYAMINIFAVKFYGETEFWLSIGKFILVIGLFVFTLVSMCGGNPQHDKFGFRNFHPGFNEYISTGNLGKFEGFLSSLITATFVIVGPEYISMAAGETENPRIVLKKSFKTIIFRLCFFYIFGALCAGILVSSTDPNLALGGTVSSPYVIAMTNLGIRGLPDLVNGVLITAAFSAGNSFVYCGSRILHSLSVRGFFFKIFAYTTKTGVPIYCVAVSIAFSCLSLLQLGNGSGTVLGWMVNICTGAQILNYTFMSISYLFFYRALKVQGIDRSTLPYVSYFQPYTAIICLVITSMMVGVIGYTSFKPWSVDNFIVYYIMVFIDIAIYLGWKIVKRTKLIRPEDVDLTSGLEEIEEHEAQYQAEKNAGTYNEQNIFFRFLDKLL